MTGSEESRLDRGDLFRVLLWRVDTLLNAGYSREQARDLGADLSVDVHQAVELLRAGTPSEQAAFRLTRASDRHTRQDGG